MERFKGLKKAVERFNENYNYDMVASDLSKAVIMLNVDSLEYTTVCGKEMIKAYMKNHPEEIAVSVLFRCMGWEINEWMTKTIKHNRLLKVWREKNGIPAFQAEAMERAGISI